MTRATDVLHARLSPKWNPLNTRARARARVCVCVCVCVVTVYMSRWIYEAYFVYVSLPTLHPR